MMGMRWKDSWVTLRGYSRQQTLFNFWVSQTPARFKGFSMFSWWRIYCSLPEHTVSFESAQGLESFCYQTYWKTTDMTKLGFMCFIGQWHHDRWEYSAKKSQNCLTLSISQTNHMHKMPFNPYNDLNIIQTRGKKKKILTHHAYYSKTFDAEQNTKDLQTIKS